jgi:hypothetical protein
VTKTEEIVDVLEQAKRLAKRYRELTGRPLGIAGEIAEAEAVRLLGVELAPVFTAGYDVIRHRPDGSVERLQVKGRVMHSGKLVGRLGTIRYSHEWDGVLLVLLNHDFNATRIFEASRAKIIEALTKFGSKSRNERGALAIPMFCRSTFSRQVWPQVNA